MDDLGGGTDSLAWNMMHESAFGLQQMGFEGNGQE